MKSAKAMAVEMKKRTDDMSMIKTDVAMEYRKTLQALRSFLDNAGLHMPVPKWHYEHKNQSTWLFTEKNELNKKFRTLQDMGR